MKKIFSFLAVAVVVTCLTISGCGPNNKTTTPENTSPPPKGDPDVLKVGSGDNDEGGGSALEAPGVD